MKNQVIETIRKDFEKVDMVVYSMAASREERCRMERQYHLY